MILAVFAKMWSFGTWFFSGLVALLASWVVPGVRAAKRRKESEPPVSGDGGSFNPYRHL